MSFYPQAESAPAILPRVPGKLGTRQGHAVLLCVTEPLDVRGAAPFLERALPLVQSCHCVIVDLRRAEFIDSSGVRALLQVLGETEAEEKTLRLIIEPGSRVERTLGLLQLQDRFRIYQTLPEAWFLNTSSTA
jgi:anti-anti-sigma factor